VRLEPAEERSIHDHAVLDDFCQAGGQLARRQRLQRAGIGQDCDRLMERADHVLRARMIDGRFAANGRVDLGE
jgi:hypothetical protein